MASDDATHIRGPAKKQAILDGALEEFARDGYSRANMGRIAQRSAVSTRTLYKYFPSKMDLFREVLGMSASRVADDHVALIEEHLPPGADPDALAPFARAWVGSGGQEDHWPLHSALFRHTGADVGNLPEDVVATWLDAGPRRVQGALSERLRAWGESGDLAIDDASLAAAQFSQLVMPGGTRQADPDPVEDTDAWVDAAVTLFLRGYGHAGLR